MRSGPMSGRGPVRGGPTLGRGGLAICAFLLSAAPWPPAPASAQTADFWREVKSPGYQRSRTLLRHGMDELMTAAGLRSSRPPVEEQAYAQNAITRFRLAHELAPDDPDALYLLARTLATFRGIEAGQGLTPNDQEARQHFEALRRIDPEYRAPEVAFELAILHTRAHRFAEAAAEYHRCLAVLLMPGGELPVYRTLEDVLVQQLFGGVSANLVRYNLGDTLMVLNDLAGAEQQYGMAIATAEQSADPRQFHTLLAALWGSAVARDRLGEHAGAMEQATRAIELDEQPMAALHAPSFFLEPPYEIHYYEGLGHMGLARLRTDAIERRDALRSASKSFHRFLHEGGHASPWARLARRHLQRLEEEVAAGR